MVEGGSFNELPTELIANIEEQSIRVACSGFARERSVAFVQDVVGHIRSGRLYGCLDGNGEMVAFRIVDFPRSDIVYLAGAVKSLKAPRLLIRELTRKILEDIRPAYTITRTQNSQVIDMLVNLFDEVVPLDRPPTPEEIEAIRACGIINFTADTLVIPRHYGSPMIENGPRPKSREARVETFMSEIDYFAGDARVLVGRRLK